MSKFPSSHLRTLRSARSFGCSAFRFEDVACSEIAKSFSGSGLWSALFTALVKLVYFQSHLISFSRIKCVSSGKFSFIPGILFKISSYSAWAEFFSKLVLSFGCHRNRYLSNW